jgi:hypothetical protein
MRKIPEIIQLYPKRLVSASKAVQKAVREMRKRSGVV